MKLLFFAILLIFKFSKIKGQGHLPPPENNQVCLIVPPDVEQCYRRFQGKPIDDKAAQVNCLQRLLWNFTPDVNNTQAEIDYFKSLAGDLSAYTASSILRHGGPRPPTGRRARQEYRTLTPEERARFHAALKKLYEDGTIRAFARLHARAFTSHHNGPSFLPYHRVFLALFEEALRRVDSRVSLPFFDTTIDNDMDNPVNSVIWSPEYIGNGIGDVTSGPAAGWVTDQGNLERNYGQRSKLFSKDQIRTVISKCQLEEISKPTAEIQYDFELYSGGPKIWVGGDMSSPATAGYDPVFYMHHAFVDYVWELFRRRQFRRCGIDPTQDYPNVPAGNSHAPESPMVGFEWLTNADGLKHYWIDNWYYYESTPSCPNCCRGCPFPAPIYCDRQQRVCVARSRRTFAFGPRGGNTSPAEAFAQASLDAHEIEALMVPTPPRNRGMAFQHPPNDGRTIHTAISDAFAAFNTESAPQRSTGSGSSSAATRDRATSSRDRQSSTRDRPISESRRPRTISRGRTSRRNIPEGWGTPADMRAVMASRTRQTSAADMRRFQEGIGPSSGRLTSPEVGLPTGLDTSGGRLPLQDRRMLTDPRGSSPDRRTLMEGIGSTADGSFPGLGPNIVDRRLAADSRISVEGRRRPVSLPGSQEFPLPGGASFPPERFMTSEPRTSSSASENVSRLRQAGGSEGVSTGRRLGPAPAENMVAPPETPMSTRTSGPKKSVLDMTSVKLSMRSPRNRGRTFDAPPSP